MDIFNSNPGVVAIVGDQKALPGRIFIETPKFPVNNAPILISGIDYNQQTNQQFQTALDGSVYIYVFGDQMGDIQVQGVAFAGLCTGARDGGITQILKYYATNRASKKADPVIIVAGGEPIGGFLTAIKLRDNVSSSDPIAAVTNYTLVINSLPQR